MKGDFTRTTFRKQNHYRSVRMQQGRVQLDADWNEQMDIQAYTTEITRRDTIGACGTPKNENGFHVRVTPDGQELVILPGRFYVDGVLCELEAPPAIPIEEFPADHPDRVRLLHLTAGDKPLQVDQWGFVVSQEDEAAGKPGTLVQIHTIDEETGEVTLSDDVSGYAGQTDPRLQPAITHTTQPDLPGQAPLNPVEGRNDLVYLDVWKRHVTAVEDPRIREVALGGPDTATRVQVLAQVRIREDAGGDSCEADLADWPPPSGTARLSTRLETTAPTEDLCDIVSNGGYRGLENHLYRVEIHQGGGVDTATFKWSRDNGSIVFGIEEFLPGLPEQIRLGHPGRDATRSLTIGDWVEILGDQTELRGEPGLLVQIQDLDRSQGIVTLSADVSAFAAQEHPRLRKWDQAGEAIPVNGGEIELEDGILVEFSGDRFRTGDYWVFAARTATREIESLTEAPPRGIHHHYCKLALIHWRQIARGWEPEIDDCRPQFPGLAEMCAEDVCFDNSVCQLPDADTVQEALESLCRQRDLRHHNKHLHGWGIVCGLQVHCGPDGKGNLREQVTVRTGYAIDCEGRDMVLDRDEVIELISRIHEHDDQNPKDPFLDENGNGEVCLTLEFDARTRHRIGIDKLRPSDFQVSELLKGTLLMNFYNHCLKPVVEFFKDEFTPGPEDTGLVTPLQKRLVTFLNLVIQLVHPQGRFVFLSRKEHHILEGFYNRLRALLQSKTFCAMFAGVDFPDYPFENSNLSTIFGKGFHTRLRLNPDGTRAYTVGAGNKIHVFDLAAAGEMVAEVEFPGGEGAEVQDVAFSPDGSRLYAVATLEDTDTVFAVADIDDLNHVWRPVHVMCEIRLLSLATAPGVTPNLVYAVGQGSGLYVFDPDNIPVAPTPMVPFNAVGHLMITEEGNTPFAFATARSDTTVSDEYQRVLRVNLPDGSNPQVFELREHGTALTGDDDFTVAVDPGRNIGKLYVVANPPTGSGQKRLLFFDDALSPTPDAPARGISVENTDIRLVYHAPNGYLILSFEDSFHLGLVDVAGDSLEPDYRHPVQIAPVSLVSSPGTGQVYALNFISNTISAIPESFLLPENQVNLDDLVNYRNEVFDAYRGLLGGFLQYLKDCFCDQVLVNCPQCDEDDRIYLACVKIRDDQVFQVCNFSKRKYVKSFPTIGYWLSVFPILPFLKLALERVCCAVLPDMFAKRNGKGMKSSKFGFNLRGRDIRHNIKFARSGGFKNQILENLFRFRTLGTFVGDWIGARLRKPTTPKPPGRVVKQREVLGVPVKEAQSRLSKANVKVEGVEAYDPAKGDEHLKRFTGAPLKVAPGQRVILYEEKGVVRYYALVEEAPPSIADLREKVEAQETAVSEVSQLKEQVSTLSQSLAGMEEKYQQAIAERDQEIARLQASVESLQKGLSEVEQLKKELGQLKRRTAGGKKKEK